MAWGRVDTVQPITSGEASLRIEDAKTKGGEGTQQNSRVRCACLMHLQASKELLQWTDKGQRYGTRGRRDNGKRGWMVWGTAILRTWVSLAGRRGSSSGF